jgi:putative hemolysin
MLTGFLFVGVAVVLISMLVALESALVQTRRPFLVASTAELRVGDAGEPSQVAVSEFVSAARIAAAVLLLSVGVVLGRIWGLYLSSNIPRLAGELGATTHVAHHAMALVAAVLVGSAILVGAYLIPSQLGARFPDRIISTMSPFGLLVVRLISPWMAISRLIGRLGSTGDNKSAALEEEAIEEDIRSLVEEGERAGVIEEEEREIISRVFTLGDKPVISIMTPRSDVVFLKALMSPAEALQVVLEARYTFYPVLKSDETDVVGVVSAHDVFALQQGDGALQGSLKGAVATAIDVPESMSALELLEQFKEVGGRFAIVRDEYGMITGIATVEDVLKVIVGELGAVDGEERSITRREDGSLLVDASSDVQNLFEFLGFSGSTEEEGAPFHSVGGFVMTSLGRIPKAGEAFLHGGFRFEVVDMDGKRIDKVLVSRCETKSVVGE